MEGDMLDQLVGLDQLAVEVHDRLGGTEPTGASPRPVGALGGAVQLRCCAVVCV
jgi:hypothetical protein